MSAIDWRRLTTRVEVPQAYAELAWEWAIAMPYRCLADPDSGHGQVMPASPEAIPDENGNFERRHQQSLAYFTALQSFLTYSFGWTRHDKGLLWWYEADWPVDDARLAFIKDIYLSDGTLTGYLAWCTTIQPVEAARPLRSWSLNPDLEPVRVPPAWREEFRAARSTGIWAGGTDPLHLGGGWHGTAASGIVDGVGGVQLGSARLASVDPDSRTAIFVADEHNGWYANLAHLGKRLPPLENGRNWHVDVYVRPIGYLGSYRRSRETGLWFAGKHRYHVVGN